MSNLYYSPMQLAFTLSSSSRRLAVKTNLTPYLASAMAVCSPIPLEAPVMKTTFPFSLPMKCKIHDKCMSMANSIEKNSLKVAVILYETL